LWYESKVSSLILSQEKIFLFYSAFTRLREIKSTNVQSYISSKSICRQADSGCRKKQAFINISLQSLFFHHENVCKYYSSTEKYEGVYIKPSFKNQALSGEIKIKMFSPNNRE